MQHKQATSAAFHIIINTHLLLTVWHWCLQGKGLPAPCLQHLLSIHTVVLPKLSSHTTLFRPHKTLSSPLPSHKSRSSMFFAKSGFLQQHQTQLHHSESHHPAPKLRALGMMMTVLSSTMAQETRAKTDSEQFVHGQSVEYCRIRSRALFQPPYH